MWITTPTTAIPLPYIDESGRVLTDRRGMVIYHQDAWLLPIRPRKKADKVPHQRSSPLLAYVAAETGLHITGGKEPLDVFKTALHALTAAADSVPESQKVEGAGKQQVIGAEEWAPSRTLH